MKYVKHALKRHGEIILTKGFDLFVFFSYCSVDLQEVCEEGQTDTDKMHIPVVSPTGVQCKGWTTLV